MDFISQRGIEVVWSNVTLPRWRGKFGLNLQMDGLVDRILMCKIDLWLNIRICPRV